MITNPTVLKYDVDAHLLIALYEEGRKSRAGTTPHTARRWWFRFPAPRLPRPAFAKRHPETAGAPTSTNPAYQG